MSLPRQIAASLGEAKIKAPTSGVFISDGAVCEGAAFHSPQPLVLHEVEVVGRKAMLCGTCMDNYGVLDSLLTVSGGKLAWPVRREFGNKIRALVKDTTDG